MSHRNKIRKPFRLAEVLAQQGRSIQTLARDLNVDYRGLRRIASGATSPRWLFAVRLAEALGVPLDRFAHRSTRPAEGSSVNGEGAKGGRK